MCPSPSSLDLATVLGSSIPLATLAIVATAIFMGSVGAACKYRSKARAQYCRVGEGEDWEEEEEEEEEEKERNSQGEGDENEGIYEVVSNT